MNYWNRVYVTMSVVALRLLCITVSTMYSIFDDIQAPQPLHPLTSPSSIFLSYLSPSSPLLSSPFLSLPFPSLPFPSFFLTIISPFLQASLKIAAHHSFNLLHSLLHILLFFPSEPLLLNHHHPLLSVIHRQRDC